MTETAAQRAEEGPRRLTPGTYWPRWFFLRLLGVVFLIAFWSYWVQIEGLIGSQGILPVAPLLDALRDRLGPERYLLFPTLCWVDASDLFLKIQCGLGVAFSLLLTAGIAPVPSLVGCWGLYSSLVTAGRTFFGFQWDNLLLEAGFLSIFFAPLGWWPAISRESSPPRVSLWLLRWLLFRLMFLSGVVKLASGDPTWRSLTALRYHYETQPLPTVVAWFAHQLPAGFQTLSAAILFAIELGLPFLIFVPGRARLVAFVGFVGLQLLIAATGNYAFFNLLTVALCILLLDDSLFPVRLRRKLPLPSEPRPWRKRVLLPLASVVMLLSVMQMGSTFFPSFRWPSPLLEVYRWAAPLRSVNSYGLFAVMTTSRPEIVIEGSNDGEHWQSYAFKWKPGDGHRRPRWVAPYQPRLDWQMWFAALGHYRQSPWFVPFLERLLEGSPAVLDLLGHDPFPESPPRYVRAVLYRYRFTDWATLRSTGAWWSRQREGLYSPVMSRGTESER